MQPAATAIEAALAVNGIANAIRGNRVLSEWNELVGSKVASRTRPDGIHDRTLWIEVATSAWLHELSTLKASLLARLVERIGPPQLFEDIKFRLAIRQRREQVTAPPPRRRAIAPPPAMPMPATGLARERIVREVATVDDAELRELIARVRITHDK